jgi:hypothetical protein
MSALSLLEQKVIPNVLLREQPLEAHLAAGITASETPPPRGTLTAPSTAARGSREPLESPPYNLVMESDEHE